MLQNSVAACSKIKPERKRGSTTYEPPLVFHKPNTGEASTVDPFSERFKSHEKFVMKKDAYYFPHDSNAKDDEKCIILLEELGPEGYGIFWILVETLRDNPRYRARLKILPAIARRYNTTHEKVRAVVTRYDLFVIEEDEFFLQSIPHRTHEAIGTKPRTKETCRNQEW